MRWSCNWNRPLSREERAIARRLANAPATDLAPTAQGDPQAAGPDRERQEIPPKPLREEFDRE